MKVGAHVSTSGGMVTGFDRAEAIGAECMQIFESAPQQWGTAKLTDEQGGGVPRAYGREPGVGPVFIHGK